MKIDDGPLNRYLIKHLQPLTEADPSLLANYVAALLKNNKPKKELHKLCVDQLYDFLGDGTKSFVARLFQSLEERAVPVSAEEMETSKVVEGGTAITSGGDAVELRISPPQPERHPSTAVQSFSDDGEEESTDDEDDDRNHKHRRRVSRSRSFDRDGDEGDGTVYRKRGRTNDSESLLREDDHQGTERKGSGHPVRTDRDRLAKFDRRMGRDHGAARFSAEIGQRSGVRSNQHFRVDGPGHRFDNPNGMMRGSIGRGRGGTWAPHDQRFPPTSFPEGAEFSSPLLPAGPGAGFFPGRGLSGRGAAHAAWPGYGPLPALGNGPLDHSHQHSGGLGGGRGLPSISAGMGLTMNVNLGRPRCLDFEERGYCLRGDLCPMEHGANRIVVEDVQSLSKFNLPVSLPSGRGIGAGPASAQSSGPILPPGLPVVGRTTHVSRDMNLPAKGEDPSQGNGIVPGREATEPDSYDPDQPLWNKDRTEAGSTGIRPLTSFPKGGREQHWTGDPADKPEDQQGSAITEAGRRVRLAGNANGSSQASEGVPTVWDRIGPVVSISGRLDAGLRTTTVLELPHLGKQPRKDDGDEVVPRPRVAWQGKWNRKVDTDEGSAHRISSDTLSSHGRGRGSGRGDAGADQRSGEGTSYGPRGGVGGRNSGAFGTERAQRTLYVSFIPVSSNRTERLLAHFQKFGDVLDVRIPANSDRAFVQFSRREDAEAALTAPDAVMGNRFIRLSWANRDSIPEQVDGGTPGGRAVKSYLGISPRTLVPIPTVSAKTDTNGSLKAQREMEAIEAGGKFVPTNGLPSISTTAAVSVKKQEELERMREAIRKKQEALAHKRNDFRRKLDKLAKHEPPEPETINLEQPLKRQRLDDTEESVVAPQKPDSSQHSPSSSTATPPVDLAPTAVLVKTKSVDALSKQVAPSGPVQVQPSPKGGRLPHARISNASTTYAAPVAWGPARFKLDNRTTMFKVLPPFPASVVDVEALKDHFVMFGDLASVEVDDAGCPKIEGRNKLSGSTSVRVNFSTRRAAERAFVQGRWLQGQNLQLAWVNSPSSTAGSDHLGEKPSMATPKRQSQLPVSAEQAMINGSRSRVLENKTHGQEVSNVETVGEGVGVTGDTGRNLSNSADNLPWRRDTGIETHVLPQSRTNNVDASSPT